MKFYLETEEFPLLPLNMSLPSILPLRGKEDENHRRVIQEGRVRFFLNSYPLQVDFQKRRKSWELFTGNKWVSLGLRNKSFVVRTKLNSKNA